MAIAQKSLRVIFDEASELGTGGCRQAYLDEVCRGDTRLRTDVEDLLWAQETAGGFLADPKRGASAAGARVTEGEGDHIGRYQLLQKIGEGGCGSVYMAEQTEPVRRRVALKIIKLGMDTRSFVARFEAERQALALMDHANIARVLDAGATDAGRPYFVMELVRGIRITDHCEREGLSIAARLRLFIQVCQAVHHAHQKGIIHRDLKPSNILVTSDDGVPFPKVIDFGIAKATGDIRLTDKTLFTRFEMFIGTPAYMSPEQVGFNASDIDTRTDIYALGVLLYELLTGHLPFDSETWFKSGIDALRKAIRDTEPTPPSIRLTQEPVAPGRVGRVAPLTPPPDEARAFRRRHPRVKETIAQLRGELDWIVLKALEKDRTRRYQSAADFAADLRHHLDHEPVVAGPPGRVYRLRKLIRRNRPAFAIATAVALLLVAAVVFGAWDITRTRRAERTQRELRRQAEEARNETDAANRRLNRDLFFREWRDAEQLLDQGKAAPALAWFAHAARAHPSEMAVQTRLLSILTEGRFALPAADPFVHDAALVNASFSADDRLLLTAAEDGRVRLWPLGTGGKPQTFPQRFSRPAVAAVSPGNRVLVEDEESVSLWELNGTCVKSVPLRHRVTGRLTTTPDRRFAALSGADGRPQLWDTTELRPVGRPMRDHDPSSDLLAVSPDGRYLVGQGMDARICAWEISSGRRVWQLNWTTANEVGTVSALAVHPDGTRIVVSRRVRLDGWELQIWDFDPEARGDREVREPTLPLSVLPHRSAITTLSISADGGRVFAGDDRGQVRWGDFIGQELYSLSSGHDGQILWHGLTVDGRRLATASVEGTVRLWDLHMNSPEPRVFTNGSSLWDAKFSPDSRWFASAGSEAVEIRDTDTGALRHQLPLTHLLTRLDISPDGRRIVACDAVGSSRVWDTETGRPVIDRIQSPAWDYVEFSHDGRHFLVRGAGNTLEIRDTETGRLAGPMLTNIAPAMTAHFSPDGHRLIASTVRGELEFWTLPEGRRLETPDRHKDIIWTTRFSPDGRRLLTASRDRTAALWDPETGHRVREFRHDHEVYNAAFSPDGRRVLTGDANGRSHVWDAESGARLFTLMPHPAEVWYGEFSPDGRVFLTGDTGRVRLWDAESGLPISGWIGGGNGLKRAHFSPDGRLGLSAVNDGTVHLWPVLIAPLPAPTTLPELAEAVAGCRLRDDGTQEPVPVERWHSLRASLASRGGDDFYARWARWFLIERMEPRPAAFTP